VVEYEVHTKKFDFGDNRFENALLFFGFSINRVRTDGENLIYDVKIGKYLTPGEKTTIKKMDGVSQIAIVD
jgi:hypothetical protein